MLKIEDFKPGMTVYDVHRRAGYLPNLEISESSAKVSPNNCAVIERTADGVSVGPCLFFLEGGTTCPRHGKVK